MDSTLESCSKSSPDREALILEFMRYAKAAARNASYKWDLDKDDTMQVILMDAWSKVDWALTCEQPIAALRSGIKYSVGHEVTSRYWRRGRGETDQMQEGFDTEDPRQPDIELKIDIERAIEKLTKPERCVVVAAQYGYSMRSLSELSGIAATTLNGRLKSAAKKIKAHMDGETVREYGASITLSGPSGRVVCGGISAVMADTGLSKGSVHNLRSGARDSVNGWSIVG